MKYLFLLLGIATLAPVALHASKPPFIKVTHTKTPPTLNGDGSDPGWQRTIAIQDFTLPTSHRSASEKTEVRLLWDKDNLYISALLHESLLTTASQQQHEIKANATERDDKVVFDDSFLIILKPEHSDSAFEFAINTRGIIEDAQSSASAPWETRNLGWNASIASAVKIGDGHWTAELAIPWKALGARPPEPGTQWEAIIGRNAAARNEPTSWNPSGPGIHAPEQWGILQFGGDSPAIQLNEPISTLEPGKNKLELTLHASAEQPANLLVSTEITPTAPAARPLRSRSTHFINGEKPVTASHNFEISDTLPHDDLTLQWEIADAATLAPLYRSPGIKTDVISSFILFYLTVHDSYRLFVNDTVVAEGERADGIPIKIPLHTGVNTLCLETRSGTAAIKLDSPDLGEAPIRWKVRDASEPDALRATVDDSAWPTAPEGEDGWIGTPGKPAVLRHTILLQETRLFPSPIPALYVAAGGVQPITFTTFGLPGRLLRDWKIFLEVDGAIEVVGCGSYYSQTPDKAKFQFKRTGPSSSIIEADNPIAARNLKSHSILSILDITLRRTEEAAEATTSASLRHYARANNYTLSELAQKTKVEFLPPLRGRQPKKLRWQLWGNFFPNLDNKEMQQDLLKTARAAGFNEFVGATGADGASAGIDATMGVSFYPYSLNFGPWLEHHPEARLIDSKGEASENLICTSVLLDHGWRDVGAPLLKKWWETRRVHTINYDFECSPFSGPHSCFCPRCLGEFCKSANIPSSTSAVTILESYRPEWTDFMARRVAKVFLLMKETVHELPNKVQFELYSGYQIPETPSRYGVDWKYVGELKAADRVGVGYGRPVPGIEETVKALAGIPVLFGELVTPYLNDPLEFRKQSIQATKASLLRRSLDATGGILLFHTQNMDGRSWYAAAETSRLITEYESLFEGSRPEAVPGHPPSEVQILHGKDAALLCLMNLERTEKSYSVTLPSETGQAREFYTGQTVTPKEGFQINLKPGETAVYILNNANER